MTADDVCTFDFAIRTDNDFDFNRADQSNLLCDCRVSWSWLGNRFSRFLAGYARSSRAYENGSAKALFQSHTVPPLKTHPLVLTARIARRRGTANGTKVP